MAIGYSLHVGLNAVDPKAYQGWPGTLQACENDARAMKALAEQLGYTTTLLLTTQATARNVTAAISTAARSMTAGDIFLLTYSGHGSQVPDTNGDESAPGGRDTGAAPDAYDETWVLYDRQLIDDELWALWSQFPARSRVVMLSDSCHSGTVSKGAPDLLAIPRPSSRARPSSRRMPLDVEEKTYRAHKRKYDGIQAKVPSRSATVVRASIALISGCQDNQESSDGKVNGLFTQRLLSVWDKGRFTGSLKELRDLTSARMPRSQTPNLYTVGSANKALLSAPALRI